jgi:hypothetical protein
LIVIARLKGQSYNEVRGVLWDHKSNCLRDKIFTLLEVILSLGIITVLSFLGKNLIHVTAENNKSVEKTRIVCKRLDSLLTHINNHLESILLFAKEQHIFEICKKTKRIILKYFFHDK